MSAHLQAAKDALRAGQEERKREQEAASAKLRDIRIASERAHDVKWAQGRPLKHRLLFLLFRKPIAALILDVILVAHSRGLIDEAARRDLIDIFDRRLNPGTHSYP